MARQIGMASIADRVAIAPYPRRIVAAASGTSPSPSVDLIGQIQQILGLRLIKLPRINQYGNVPH